jgi:inorganic pyrophosphatase
MTVYVGATDLEYFFQTSKRLHDSQTELDGWAGRDAAVKTIVEARQRFRES